MSENENILEKGELNKNPFQTPENYFDSFETNISNRIGGKNEHKVSKYRISYQSISFLAAACVALFLIVKVVLHFQFTEPKLVDKEMLDYIELGLVNDINEMELMAEMESMNNNETELISNGNNTDENSNQIIDFLITENINLQTIESEF